MKIPRLYSSCLVCLTVLGSTGRFTAAQENASAVDPAAVLAPFLGDDTFAVGYVDLAAIDPPGLLAMVVPLLDLPQPAEQLADLMAAKAQEMLTAVQAAGVRRIYCVIGLSDLHAGGGPLLIVPTRDARGAEELKKILTGALGPVLLTPGMLSDLQRDLRFERHASGPMILCTQATLDRYAIKLATPREDLTGPLAHLAGDGAAVAGVFAPGSDFRRVVRELWPELPPPFTPLSGELLADKLRHIEFAARLSGAFPPPEDASQGDLLAHVAIESTDAPSAAVFQQFIRDVPDAIPQARGREAAELLRAAISSLTVRLDGTQTVVDLPSDQASLAKLREAILQPLQAAREANRRNERLTQMKELMYVMANYESANKTLPPAAIRDDQGHPLLSWRVAILPIIGYDALYRQFHLDEPWDSPHNRTLIQHMPDLFADPDPKFAELARAGKTTFQVPVGPETAFYKNEGTRMKEITDGYTNTISIVEVIPERAVEWTRPADWEVDMENPLEGVRRSDRSYFVAGFVDSHATPLKNDIDADTFRALLTRAGGENMSQLRQSQGR